MIEKKRKFARTSAKRIEELGVVASSAGTSTGSIFGIISFYRSQFHRKLVILPYMLLRNSNMETLQASENFLRLFWTEKQQFDRKIGGNSNSTGRDQNDVAYQIARVQ